MRLRRMHWLAALLALATAAAALALLTGVFEMASRYEEPAFTVTRTTPQFEIRAYTPTIEAQVTMPGTHSQAVTASFRVLAGYIFGGNAPRSTLAMTTPVSASPASELAPLQRDAVGGGLHMLDVSVVSQFNPPWVLGPWRRNEVRWLLAD